MWRGLGTVPTPRKHACLAGNGEMGKVRILYLSHARVCCATMTRAACTHAYMLHATWRGGVSLQPSEDAQEDFVRLCMAALKVRHAEAG